MMQSINKNPTIWESDPKFVVSIIALLIISVFAAALISFFLFRYNKQKVLLKNEIKVREVKERYERIINTAPLAFMLSIDGKVVEANAYIEKHIGIKQGCISSSFYTDSKQYDKLIEKALYQEVVDNEIVRFNMKDGTAHRFISHVNTVEYNGQQGFILWGIDIEEREKQKDQLNAVRRDLQTIMDNMPIPIRIVDIDNYMQIYANKAATEMFEIPILESMYGVYISDFTPKLQPDGIETSEKLKSVILSEKPSTIELTCQKADGTMFDVLFTECLIDYNGKKASLGIMQDLTAKKEYQEIMNGIAEKERDANQLKSRFLVNMSHEIRTPMNAIIGLTEIELRKSIPKEVKSIYHKINISAKNLLEIINDILDLSKIEADKIELFEDEFELEEVLNSAILVATPRLDGKNVELMLNVSLELPRFMIGDKTRFWQILKNFLDNSAKYTEKGKILLSVFANKERSDNKKITLTIIIEDTGIGIDEEQIKKLFMPYEQFRNDVQKRYTGTGLGMSISKQLCEIMGGELQLQSNIGIGTTIIVNIPFKRSKNKETGIQVVKKPALAGLNILAVDDDKVSLDIMAKLFEGAGINYILSENGQKALEIIYKRHDRGEFFDMILLDYMLEGINGLEMAKRIHMTLSKAPKLLMVTAYQKILLKHEIEESGIDDVLEKPFIPSQFIQKISTTLGYDDELDDQKESYIRFNDVHVLLCEDYHMNQEVAAGMLLQFGIETDIAENGEKGIEMLQSEKAYDMIFMDLQMPVMDGYEATRIIRLDERFKNIPIISLTADAMKEIVEKCIEMGMNDHIAKPIEFETLHRVLVKWLPENKQIVGDELLKSEIDYSNKGLARFGGDRELYEKALFEFSELILDEWPDFITAVANINETGRYIHKLKGAAGNLSEMRVYRHAVEFENSLRQKNPSREFYERLIDVCSAVRTRIITHTKDLEHIEHTLEDGTIEEFIILLDMLRNALLDCDPVESSKSVKLLKQKTWINLDEEKLNQLYRLERRYEFDEAIKMIDIMKSSLLA